MSDDANIDVAPVLTSDDFPVSLLMKPTALAAAFGFDEGSRELKRFAGKLTLAAFGPVEFEIASLLNDCGVFDLGWRALIHVRGEDRLRWLSGMTTNAVQQLGEGTGNYSFFLNAQGRIQGDALVYRDDDELLLDTTVEQVGPLIEHLDRFIIMDDVVLEAAGDEYSALGLAGPNAGDLLVKVGITLPEASADTPICVRTSQWRGSEVRVVTTQGTLTPQFALFCPADVVLKLWEELLTAGAHACGVEAVEALRIMEGLPRFGVDVTDRDLPQETSQTRALNFNKGCYLGQEIVERIRSRGAVHRSLMKFLLEGKVPDLPAELMVAGKSVGRITSAVSLDTLDGRRIYGMGIVRGDAMSKGEAVTYNGGEVLALERPPVLSFG